MIPDNTELDSINWYGFQDFTYYWFTILIWTVYLDSDLNSDFEQLKVKLFIQIVYYNIKTYNI